MRITTMLLGAVLPSVGAAYAPAVGRGAPVAAGRAPMIAAAPSAGRHQGASTLAPGDDWVLVLDLTVSEDNSSTANRVFSISRGESDPVARELVDRVIDLVRSPADSLAKSAAVRAFLRTNAQKLASKMSNRWVGREGDRIDVVVLRPKNTAARIDLDEAARQTRLTNDLVTLVQVAQKVGALTASPGARAEHSFTHKQYFLTRTRASLTATASLPKAGSAGAADDDQNGRKGDAKATDEESPGKVNTTIVTGPREHFFLSANAAFTQIRQVKYNETSKTFEPDKKPTEFFIGVDYQLGDLYDERRANALQQFLAGVYVGVALEASTRPFNQVAATLGFRRDLPWFDQFLTFEAVSPYVGVVWARNDRPAAPGADSRVESKYGKGKFIYGLSLNLDKALGWLTPDKKEGAAQ